MNNEIKVQRPRVFLENPYDLETVSDSLNIASRADKELIYLDRLIVAIRTDPTCELTSMSHKILSDLGII